MPGKNPIIGRRRFTFRNILIYICIFLASAGFTVNAQDAKTSQKKVDQEHKKREKEAQKEYQKALKEHHKRQSKATKSMMRQSKKDAKKNTPLKKK